MTEIINALTALADKMALEGDDNYFAVERILLMATTRQFEEEIGG